MASRLFSRSKYLALARLRSPLPAIDPSVAAAASSFRSFNSLASHPLLDPRSPVGPTRRADLSAPASSAFTPNAGFQLSRHLESRKIWGCMTTSVSHPFSSQKSPQSINMRAENVTATPQVDKIHSQLNSSGKKIVPIAAAGTAEPSDLNRKESGFSNVTAFSPLEGSLVKQRKSSLSALSSQVRLNELSVQITYWLIPALLVISKTQWTTSLLVLSVYWQIYWFFKEILLDYVHHEVTRKWVLVYFSLLLLILAKETILDFNLLQ